LLARRKLLKVLGGTAIASVLADHNTFNTGSGVARAEGPPDDIERWMNEWMAAGKTASGTLHLSRFVEPIYFLTRSISWRPGAGQDSQLEPVEVPKGFVTDFASIPRVFWSLLRPDGEYTYAAIIHDYLYWEQKRSRAVADQIFKFAMHDFDVSSQVIGIIYAAVRVAGGHSWNEVMDMKARGERRILKRFPEDPRTRWEEWKKRADVFG
jgi:hypothetical protein